MKKVLIAISIMIVIMLSTPSLMDGSDGSPPPTAKDGTGNEISLDGIPDKVIAIGKGVNATLIRLGLAEKIVVCDNHSVNADEPELDILDQRKEQGELLADGNIYTSGRSGLVNNCVYAVDRFGFDKEDDLVIMTGSEGYLRYIIDDLQGYGFRNIAVWYEMTSFGELSDYVEAISILMTGDVTDESEQMKSIPGSIADALGDTERRDAVCITYSAGEFKVNNAGSLAGSMVIAAGGNAFTIDGSKPSPTYSVSIPSLFTDDRHSDAVVFVDHQIMGNQELLSKLMHQLPGSVTVVGLEPLWNNYDIESIDGIQAMAQSMYPDVFGPYEPYDGNEGEEDTMHYAYAMVITLILISVGYTLFMRRS